MQDHCLSSGQPSRKYLGKYLGPYRCHDVCITFDQTGTWHLIEAMDAWCRQGSDSDKVLTTAMLLMFGAKNEVLVLGCMGHSRASGGTSGGACIHVVSFIIQVPRVPDQHANEPTRYKQHLNGWHSILRKRPNLRVCNRWP